METEPRQNSTPVVRDRPAPGHLIDRGLAGVLGNLLFANSFRKTRGIDDRPQRTARNRADSRNGGAVPVGNGGNVMKAARELLAAMDDAQAQATKSGQSYSPVGKDALQSLISAHR